MTESTRDTFDRSSISVITEYETLFTDINRIIKFMCSLTANHYIDCRINVKQIVFKFKILKMYSN